MSTDSQTLITTFDSLPTIAQQEVAIEILRRAQQWDTPALTDDDLVRSADDLFSELDRQEASDGI